MKIDRKHVIMQFDHYAHQYNLEDPKIKLKYDHTYRVAALCERIAHSVFTAREDIRLAWLLGMFHDIGRFEQVRRYHTFQDKDSVNHAALSADLLWKDGLIEDYLDIDAVTAEEMRLMEKAVRLHNVYRLPEELAGRERMFAEILRDADRIDILRVNCETPREDIYNLPTEAFTDSLMTDEVYQSMLNREMVNRKYSKTGIDYIMGHVAFIFGLVFDESRVIIKEQGYLDQLLSFESTVPETRERIAKAKEIIAEIL